MQLNALSEILYKIHVTFQISDDHDVVKLQIPNFMGFFQKINTF